MRKSIIPILITVILVLSGAINIYLAKIIYVNKNIIATQQAEIYSLNQQTNKETDNQIQLNNCLSLADRKYEQVWNSICAIGNNGDYCNQFIGSPKDIDFSKVKNEEKGICLKAYGD